MLRSAHVYRWDRNNPTITSSTPSSTWTNQPVWFQVQDSGLGASGVWVWEGYNIVGTGSAGCSGAHQDVCPTSAWISVNDLPEGRHNVTAVGLDPVANGSAGQGWTARIDRSAPSVTLAGDLYARQSEVLQDGSYELQVQASDGDTSSSASERSGMKSVAIYLDNDLAYESQQSCAVGSCPMARNWTLNTASLSEGEHLVTVMATDQLGHDHSEFVKVVVRAPDTLIDGGPFPTISDRDTNFSFTSGATGVTFQCRMDQASWQACSSPHYVSGLADGTHTFQVRAVHSATGAVDSTPAERTVRVDPQYVLPESLSYPQAVEGSGIGQAQIDSYQQHSVDDPGYAGPDPRRVPGSGLPIESIGWCTNPLYPERAVQCDHYRGDRNKAFELTDHLFTGNLDGIDGTRANAFLHAYWVALMVNSDPNDRRNAWDFAIIYEDDDQNSSQTEERRAARMDIVNDEGGYEFATRQRAENHNDEYFCEFMRRKSLNARNIGPNVDPYRYYQDARTRLVFRYHNRYQDATQAHTGNPVDNNGKDCSPA